MRIIKRNLWEDTATLIFIFHTELPNIYDHGFLNISLVTVVHQKIVSKRKRKKVL